MAPNPGAKQAESDKPSAPKPRMRSGLENRTHPDKPPFGGTVCRFELVRGSGEAELSRLAELQHGHVHLHQLRAAGIGKTAIANRVRTGRLHPTLPGVYLVGGRQTDVIGRCMAAALYFRGDALVAGRAAAEVWGFLDTTQLVGDREPIEVLLVGRNGAKVRGIKLHRARSVDRNDIRRRNGIPVTSPARTVLDCASRMDDLELEALLSAAMRKNLLRRSELADVMERNPGVKGIGLLRALLEQGESLHDTRSKYERKILKLVKAAELPIPMTNIKVAGKTVDAFWPDLKLVLEVDGWNFHRDKFESDRLRDQHLMLAGCHPIRTTRTQIDFRPYALVARLAAMITTLRSTVRDASSVDPTSPGPAA